jgi:hypothetical protein
MIYIKREAGSHYFLTQNCRYHEPQYLTETQKKNSQVYSEVGPNRAITMVDISAHVLHKIGNPTLALSWPPIHTEGEAATSVPWYASTLNPKNRIDCLYPACASKLGWRIDGSAHQGTRFYAIPTCLQPDLLPLRIDTYIPDQSEHPESLRKHCNPASRLC